MPHYTKSQLNALVEGRMSGNSRGYMAGELDALVEGADMNSFYQQRVFNVDSLGCCAGEDSETGLNIRKGLRRAGGGIARGAKATGRGVARGAKATGKGAMAAGKFVGKKALQMAALPITVPINRMIAAVSRGRGIAKPQARKLVLGKIKAKGMPLSQTVHVYNFVSGDSFIGASFIGFDPATISAIAAATGTTLSVMAKQIVASLAKEQFEKRTGLPTDQEGVQRAIDRRLSPPMRVSVPDIAAPNPSAMEVQNALEPSEEGSSVSGWDVGCCF